RSTKRSTRKCGAASRTCKKAPRPGKSSIRRCSSRSNAIAESNRRPAYGSTIPEQPDCLVQNWTVWPPALSRQQTLPPNCAQSAVELQGSHMVPPGHIADSVHAQKLEHCGSLQHMAMPCDWSHWVSLTQMEPRG